jgi:hypothetical protein
MSNIVSILISLSLVSLGIAYGLGVFCVDYVKNTWIIGGIFIGLGTLFILITYYDHIVYKRSLNSRNQV